MIFYSDTKKSGGFTLIELLVVISIIGLLSSVVLASLNSARQKARNAKRLSDIHQIATALELVYNETGHYPAHTGIPSNGGWTISNQTYSFAPAGLLGTSMPNPPKDPTGTGVSSGYWYYYFSPGWFGANPGSNCIKDNKGMYILGVNTMESISGHMPTSPGPDSCIWGNGWGIENWNYVVQGYENN